jgi:hypothetical protein
MLNIFLNKCKIFVGVSLSSILLRCSIIILIYLNKFSEEYSYNIVEPQLDTMSN